MNLSPNDLPELQNGFVTYLALPKSCGACIEVWKHLGHFGPQLCILKISSLTSEGSEIPFPGKVKCIHQW